MAAPGVAVLQSVPVCSTVLAGLVNRGSKLELERCAREGGCRVRVWGSTALSCGSRALCHGSTNHHTCFVFFPLKKKIWHDPHGAFWAGEESDAAKGCSSRVGSTGCTAVLQPHGRTALESLRSISW